ncbi:MAG TPA: tetratricopeptide repeat protein [Isosphaeraceae bacterium]|jgi:tetratricopeptide (TPR) repeat protein|nr:tetratricopeptide repeat protein [Isosphaeraceae bacterium]
MNGRGRVDRRRIIAVVVAGLAIVAGAEGRAQEGKPRESDRERAFRLYKEYDHEEALPLLEALAREDRQDPEVLAKLGSCLVTHAATLEAGKERRDTLIRAREVLLKAKDLGDDSDLSAILLSGLRPDGMLPPFSENKEVQKAMAAGEAAFARRKFDEAIASYQRALTLDPRQYHAALFIGDCYFARKEAESAARWFARAVKIDPDRATAYRYWGDALMIADKPDEARAKFIDAIVAEPYDRRPYSSLEQWARNTGARIERPAVFPPGRGNDERPAGTEVVDPKDLRRDDGTMRWTDYARVRDAWKGGKFLKAFPDATSYRHSLAEEAAALRALADGVAADLKDGTIKRLDPRLADLLKIRDAGLLEAHVLIDHADDGIAQDYKAYRSKQRDELRRYIAEFHIRSK